MRVSSALLPAVLLAAGVLFCSNQAGGVSARGAACEPGADLDLAARVVEVAQEGARSRVTLEVVLSSRPALRSYRVFETRNRDLAQPGVRVGTARRRKESSREVGTVELLGGRSLSLSSSPRFLRRGEFLSSAGGNPPTRIPAYALRHTVVLERGREHGLVFTAEAEDTAGEWRTVRAYVHVNLKPEEQPERLEGLVQFRARAAP